MNFEVYTIHPGFWSPIGLLDREGVYRAVHESLKAIERVSIDTGVKVGFENMPDMPVTMGKTPEDLFAMLNGFEIDVCFDVGHAHTSGTIEAFLEYADRFVNVHIHDNRGQYDEHLPIGSGTLDFKRVLRALKITKGNSLSRRGACPMQNCQRKD